MRSPVFLTNPQSVIDYSTHVCKAPPKQSEFQSYFSFLYPDFPEDDCSGVLQTCVPDCEILSGTHLRDIYPSDKVSESDLNEIATEVRNSMTVGKLDSKERLSHFFAQIRQETGANLTLTENLNYSESALPKLFSHFKNNPADATLYGRNAAHAADWEAIANRAYANRIGNGNVASGDGWKFRGRGLKQLTGRSNYDTFNTFHTTTWGGTEDFITNPDLLLQPKYATRSAIAFWVENGLPAIADEGVAEATANKVTAVVNKHTDSYGARYANLEKIVADGTFDNICFN